MQRILRAGHTATQAAASHFATTLPISMACLIPLKKPFDFILLTANRAS